ncbi:hypothetical protein SVAN01_09406 [Stagonosporopsis vannaccii]|nr:hypothetical protein SVAN01_09406 [Stagonosporopsis vannaccii]
MDLSLGLQERFELAEAQCGFMPLIVLISLFRDCSAGNMYGRILLNVQKLLKIHPLLTASVAGRLTRKPRWQASNITLDVESVVHLEDLRMSDPEDIMSKEEDKGLSLDLDQGPLWRVGIYNTTTPNGCFVALTLSHILMDGSGALKFLKLLLQNPELDSYNTRVETSRPRAEDTMSMSPTYSEAARAIGHEILINLLPVRLQGPFRKSSFWPTADLLDKRPTDCRACRHRLQLGRLGHTSVTGLKSFGKLSGSGSMQGLIHTACLIALLSVSSKTEYHGAPPTRITTETPIALRTAELGHPSFLGNYTALADFEVDVEKLRIQTLYQTTSRYHSYIHSSTGKEAAKRRAGMLGLIPDISYFTTPSFTIQGSKVTPCPTGFEMFLTRQGASIVPYRSSFAVSNLGLLEFDKGSQEMKDSLQGLWFSQSPMPWGAAFYVDVVGYSVQPLSEHEPQVDLSIMISWLDGAIDCDLAKRFETALSVQIEKIARAGNAGIDAVALLKNTTLQELAR